MATDIQTVRLRVSDRVRLQKEQFTGNGTDAYFSLNENISSTVPPVIKKNGILQVITTDYTVDYQNGLILFTTAPAAGDRLDFQYYWSIYTDDEIQYFINLAPDGNLTIATAYVLLALAADAARLAKRETLIGGGGIGQVTRDTSVAARELRELAKALIESEGLIGDNIPAEGLTNPPWTEFEVQKQYGRHLLEIS